MNKEKDRKTQKYRQKDKNTERRKDRPINRKNLS